MNSEISPEVVGRGRGRPLGGRSGRDIGSGGTTNLHIRVETEKGPTHWTLLSEVERSGLRRGGASRPFIG